MVSVLPLNILVKLWVFLFMVAYVSMSSHVCMCCTKASMQLIAFVKIFKHIDLKLKTSYLANVR